MSCALLFVLFLVFIQLKYPAVLDDHNERTKEGALMMQRIPSECIKREKVYEEKKMKPKVQIK